MLGSSHAPLGLPRPDVMNSTPARWRLLATPPASGGENMALDEALMDRARETGECVLRVYAWATPTISFGRNQTARGHYDLERIRAKGLHIVRRPTGGRAILHHREVTYSVTAPVAAAGDLRASYQRINRLLVVALDSLGVAATPAVASRRASAPGIAPCFDEPSVGELTVGGRKLAGSAQWRHDDALLQHGSILVEDDQTLLADYTIGSAPIPPPATLDNLLQQRTSVAAVTEALFEAVRGLEDVGAQPLELDDALRARVSALVVRYLDDAWTWRR
jgi:lipoyl(octanoyl) transferase